MAHEDSSQPFRPADELAATTDPTGLARLAKQGVEAAWSKLAEFVRQVAARVSNRHTGYEVQEFIDDAPGYIFERLSSYQEQRPFEPWCRRVLHNRWIDLQRKMRRREEVRESELCGKQDGGQDGSMSGLAALAMDRGQLASQQASDYQIDLRTPFRQEDLRLLEADLPRAEIRITALLVFGLWEKVPSDKWQTWLDSAELPTDLELPNILDLEDRNVRIAFVAELLGERKQTVLMRIRRAEKVIMRLHSIRELFSALGDDMQQ